MVAVVWCGGGRFGDDGGSFDGDGEYWGHEDVCACTDFDYGGDAVSGDDDAFTMIYAGYDDAHKFSVFSDL